MSQNRKFIEMLVVCDRLNLDKDVIDILSNINDQDINLRLLCKYIENIFCAKTELNKIEVILTNIFIALKNNRGNERLDVYLNKYKRFLEIYVVTLGNKKIDILYEMNKYVCLGPFWGLKS